MPLFSCAFCGLPVSSARICERCIATLPVNHTVCHCCGQPVAAALPADVLCGACQVRPPVFDRARSPYRYAFPVDAALKKLKFGHQLIFATVFAELVSPVVAMAFEDCDVIVPVPLHRGRQFMRGFNQAHEIGREVGRRCGLAVATSVVRTRATRSQSGLTARARHTNIRGAFRLKGGVPGRHPLIVDDVISTGATCNQLARVLLDGGAETVSVLTVARSGYT